MKVRRVLILAANNQSFTNVKLMCNSLSEVQIFWMDLSSIFHQSLTVPEFDHTRIELGIKSDKPFYLENPLGKLKILRSVKKQFKSRERYDLILLGDLGIVEYNLLKNVFEGRSIFIQDAILLWSEKFQIKKRIRSIFYNGARHNICDTIICSGEVTKNTLVSEGVISSKIKPIGIPRFAEYNTPPSPLSFKENKLPTYLFIGEAYAWHGYDELHVEQHSILKELDLIQSKYSEKFRLLVRKHPRDSSEYNFSNLELIDPQKISVKENVLQCDFIVNYGYPSTILFEAAKLQVPTLLIKSNSIKYEKMTNYKDFKRMVLLSTHDDLENSLLNLDKKSLDLGSEIVNLFIVSNQDYQHSLAQLLTTKN